MLILILTKMNEKLKEVYEAAKAGQSTGYDYVWYCNTHIRAYALSGADIRVEIYPPDSRSRIFSVSNKSLNTYLDLVAEWIVTGEAKSIDNPLEW